NEESRLLSGPAANGLAPQANSPPRKRIEFGVSALVQGLTLRGLMVFRTIWTAAAELARDMRFAVRSLLRAKGLAAAVIVTLGLGIGANAAIFSVVRGVLLRP